MPIATVSPVTGETLQEFKELDAAEIDARIALARETFLSYRLTPYAERARLLRAAAGLLDA
jgi:succinate-semialdehyde dehydrogenase / glutarate-semialdehyde dehydrogenase